MESQEFRPWVQNSSFSFAEQRQEKMCPSGASQPQVVEPRWEVKMESVPHSCWSDFHFRDFFSSFSFSQHWLLFTII
jgi:hypothetical protein